MKYLVLILVCFLSPLQYTGAANLGGIDDKTITLSLSQEPRSLNSLSAESVSYTAQLMVHLQEGLMRYDGRRRLVGGVAERWQLSPEQMRFWLRPDAKWQNGEPVTAHDFVFAWSQLVRPDTASPSANLASPILNAASIIRGEIPVSELGVKALSDTELIVELAHPCAWCLKLMTNSIFYPVNQAFYEVDSGSYGGSGKRHLANGAFKIARWTRGKHIHLEKNAAYWGASSIALDGIRFEHIGIDLRTQFNLFRAGELAATNLDRQTIPEALAKGYRIKTYASGQLFHIQFSHVPGMLSANQNLRQAIALVIDKQEMVNRIVASPGTRVADSMFHDWLSVGGESFVRARPPRLQKPELDKAKIYLRAAKQELGIQGDINLTLTINDSSLYRRLAEYLQQELKAKLGIKLSIDPQITQVMVEKWRNGSSDMSLITWPVDVDDPMDQISFMGDPNFRAVFKGLYAGDDMAKLYFRNRDANTKSERLDAVQAVQQLFEAKVTVLPLFESYGVTTLNPKLKGFVWQPVRGYADYRYVKLK